MGRLVGYVVRNPATSCPAPAATDSLSRCFRCRKKLHGLDIFMHRCMYLVWITHAYLSITIHRPFWDDLLSTAKQTLPRFAHLALAQADEYVALQRPAVTPISTREASSHILSVSASQVRISLHRPSFQSLFAMLCVLLAVSFNTGVPWVMCEEDDAPDPVINTCNAFYCDYFSPNKLYNPNMWTEAWTGWFTAFRGPVPHRPTGDMAFAVARLVQKAGSFVNYYMYHGGTNFGRTAGDPFVATSYDYDAPMDEFGLLRQPKWGHLRDLHRAIKMCEPALVSADPVVTSLGSFQQVLSSVKDVENAFATLVMIQKREPYHRTRSVFYLHDKGAKET